MEWGSGRVGAAREARSHVPQGRGENHVTRLASRMLRLWTRKFAETWSWRLGQLTRGVNRRGEAELLPVGYFHLVFTLPHELNPMALRNKKVLCTILFRAVSQTLLEFARTHLGGTLGLIDVLHTWDQTLRDHFHLHCLIPAGALSLDQSRWIPDRDNFLFPVKALSAVFRGKFLHLLDQAFCTGQLQFPGQTASLADPDAFSRLLQSTRQKKWVVYAKKHLLFSRKSSRLPGTLYPSGGPVQPSHPCCQRRPRHLPLPRSKRWRSPVCPD